MLAPCKRSRYSRTFVALAVPYSRLLTALRDLPAALSAWREIFHCSPLRGPSRLSEDEIAPLVAGLLESLADALPAVTRDGHTLPGGLQPGSQWVRELEKSAAFAGASLAACGGTGFEIAAAILSLRNLATSFVSPAESSEIVHLFEWLTAIAMDAFGTAKARAADERMWAMLEQRTPVVSLTPLAPAALLVGNPDSYGLDAIFDRLILQAVRTGAPVAVIDATGLSDSLAPDVLEAVGRLLCHRKVAGRMELVITGLGTEAEQVWAASARSDGTPVSFEPDLGTALPRVLELTGHALVRLGPGDAA